MSDLTFGELRYTNVIRCQADDGMKHPLGDWSVLEWAGAMAGEAGEAANKAKKLRRGDFGEPGTEKYRAGVRMLMRELADTIIYADLCAALVGEDLGEAVRETFNAKSDELKQPYKL